MNNQFTQEDGVTLREFFEERLKALQIAIDKQESANNIRLEGMNEWRNESKDRMMTYLSKAEYEVKHQYLVEKIETLQKFMYLLTGGLLLLELLFRFIK
jgi:hypothetical protein